MFLPDEGHMCDTIIAENKDLRRNKISESIDSVLSSLHIGGSKYRIYSSKTETATNISIYKMNERIESNTIFEVTYDKGEIHLLINIKYTVIVTDTGYHI